MMKKDKVNPFALSAPVGPNGTNGRLDVAKVETLTGTLGDFDLDRTEGPTGYYGERLKQGVEKYQKTNDLKVDGVLKPDGETLRKMADEAGRVGAEALMQQYEKNREDVYFPDNESLLANAVSGLYEFLEKYGLRERRPKFPPFPPELMSTDGVANRTRG